MCEREREREGVCVRVCVCVCDMRDDESITAGHTVTYRYIWIISWVELSIFMTKMMMMMMKMMFSPVACGSGICTNTDL